MHACMGAACYCHRRYSGGPANMRRYRRTEPGDRWSRNTVAWLELYATSILGLARGIRYARDPHSDDPMYWEDSTVEWVRHAVRAARMLTAREGL